MLRCHRDVNKAVKTVPGKNPWNPREGKRAVDSSDFHTFRHTISPRQNDTSWETQLAIVEWIL